MHQDAYLHSVSTITRLNLLNNLAISKYKIWIKLITRCNHSEAPQIIAQYPLIETMISPQFLHFFKVLSDLSFDILKSSSVASSVFHFRRHMHCIKALPHCSVAFCPFTEAFVQSKTDNLVRKYTLEEVNIQQALEF